MVRLPLLFVALLTVSLAAAATGCSKAPHTALAPQSAAQRGADGEKKAEEPPAGRPARAQAEQKEAAVKQVARKIIYTATLRLIVEDFPKSSDAFQKLVEDHEGYVAQAEVTSSPGAARQASWKVRVPVKQLDAFRKVVKRLGEVEVDKLDSEDITDQFYNLEDRIKTKTQTRDRLLEQQKKIEGSAKDLLAYDREIDGIQEQLDQMQGQIDRLGKLSALTTCNVTLVEKRRFDADKPPDKAETPTFGQRVGRTFADSWGVLSDFGQGVALLAVALTPWLPLLVVLGAVLWYVVRKANQAARPLVVQPVGAQPPAPAEPADPWPTLPAGESPHQHPPSPPPS
jgi:hypothetical protein